MKKNDLPQVKPNTCIVRKCFLDRIKNRALENLDGCGLSLYLLLSFSLPISSPHQVRNPSSLRNPRRIHQTSTWVRWVLMSCRRRASFCSRVFYRPSSTSSSSPSSPSTSSSSSLYVPRPVLHCARVAILWGSTAPPAELDPAVPSAARGLVILWTNKCVEIQDEEWRREGKEKKKKKNPPENWAILGKEGEMCEKNEEMEGKTRKRRWIRDEIKSQESSGEHQKQNSE